MCRRESRPSSRRVSRLSVDECINDLYKLRCDTATCSPNCFDVFKQFADAARVMRSDRLELVEAGHRGSSKLLFHMLKHMRLSGGGGRFRYAHQIRGHPCCADAWFKYHDLRKTDSRVKRVMAALNRGENEWVPTNGGTKLGRNDSRGQQVDCWLRNYVQDFTEKNPAKCRISLEPISVADLHALYVSERRLLDNCCDFDPIEYSWFCTKFAKFMVAGVFHEGTHYKLEMRPGSI